MASAPQPFVTPTIARLYLQQGKLDQAEECFLQLMQRLPEDPRVISGLAEVQRRRLAEQQTASADRAQLSVNPEEGLICHWSVSDEGRRRGELTLGASGLLVLRLVSYPAHPRRPPQNIFINQASGKINLPRPEEALLAVVAVGLLGDQGKFAAITHSEMLALAT